MNAWVIKLSIFFAIFAGDASGQKTMPVFFRGDSTVLDMRISNTNVVHGQFQISTTGACFEYIPGTLNIYQGLKSLRLIASIAFDGKPNFKIIEHNEGHALLRSEKLNIGIYGDSTCVIAPKEKMTVRCTGHFMPEYKGIFQGELLLIDGFGGIEFYTEQNNSTYQIRRLELKKPNWIVEYSLHAGERMMITAFPGRPFNWEKSYRSNILFTQGSIGELYGVMPMDELIQTWALNFDTIVLWHKGLYRFTKPYDSYSGPYLIANQREFERFIKTAHKNGLKVAVYCSLYYYHRKFKSVESFFDQISALKEKFSIDGVYIDGMLATKRGHIKSQLFTNWEIIRRLRCLFGPDGFIIYHGTSFGSPVATIPNVDTYCDATLYGENVPFATVDDNYVRYQVRKYGISNTVALWKPGPRPDSVKDIDIIDAILAMNGRERFWAGITAREPSSTKRNIWITSLSWQYRYYLNRLKAIKKRPRKPADLMCLPAQRVAPP